MLVYYQFNTRSALYDHLLSQSQVQFAQGQMIMTNLANEFLLRLNMLNLNPVGNESLQDLQNSCTYKEKNIVLSVFTGVICFSFCFY